MTAWWENAADEGQAVLTTSKLRELVLAERERLARALDTRRVRVREAHAFLDTLPDHLRTDAVVTSMLALTIEGHIFHPGHVQWFETYLEEHRAR
jgi:hypothetical protein